MPAIRLLSLAPSPHNRSAAWPAWRRALLLALASMPALIAADAPSVDSAEIARWDTRLQTLVRGRIAARKPPVFSFARMPGSYTVTELAPSGTMQLAGQQGMRMAYQWDRLRPLDRKNLAETVRRRGEPEDAALVAFYWLLAGRSEAAQADLQLAGASAEPLHALFDTAMPARPSRQKADDEPEPEPEPEPAYQGPYGFRRDGSGRFPEAEPPLSWDAASGRNICWKTPMPAKSNCSPALTARHIFVCAEPHTLLCVDRAKGEIIWQRTHSFAELFDDPAADSDLPTPEWQGYMGFTTPTPVTNGTHVWAVFGHGVVACYTAAGEQVWAERFEAHNRYSTIAASPVLADDLLIFATKGRPRVQALDAETGAFRWGCDGSAFGTSRVVRDSSLAQPIIIHAGGVITDFAGSRLHRGLLGGDYKGGESGRPQNWGPTPLVGDGMVIFHAHFKPSMIKTALRAVDYRTGEQLWEFYTNTGNSNHDRMGRSPLLDEGLVYAIRDYGHMHVIDAGTGELVYEQPGMGKSYVSTTRAGPVIVHLTKREAVLFRPGRSYQEVARFTHGFRTHIPSPIFAGRHMYYRGYDNLWCIGPKTPPGDG